MSGLKTPHVQIGLSGTATQNFTLTTGADGTATLARGDQGATTQDVLTIDANGLITATQGIIPAQNMVRLQTANGYGSTNTMIRRFTTAVVNQGSDITYADSSTLGATFTINTIGVYAISLTDNLNAAQYIGISLNSSQLTTAIHSVTAADRLCYANIGANVGDTISVTLYLSAGDVIRAHNAATPTGSDTAGSQFTITRVS